MAKTVYKSKDGDEIDRICWDFYHFTSGAVEGVLKANQDLGDGRSLADMGPILPAGLSITLPDLQKPTVVKKIVRLTD
jgi:phage tail protein X